jgi:hypothetical protein
MNNIIVCFLILFTSQSFAQCEIKSKVQPDDSMLYFMKPATFYSTKLKSLKIGIVTDKENYFIALQPSPFPLKKDNKTIKEDLVIQLSDANKYKLQHFDTRYIMHDSVMEVLYLIDKKDIKSFLSFEAINADINMPGTEFTKNYTFKLHKNAIMNQLNCFLKEEEK